MTKPLAPEEKKRRAKEREEVKELVQQGMTVGQAMQHLQKKKIAEARQALEQQDAADEPRRAAERERARIEHEHNMQEIRRADKEVEERREKARLAAENAKKIADEEKALIKASTPPKSRSKNSLLTRNGYSRCPGSTLNVEERGIVLVGEKTLRDSDPWNYRGKRVVCPECGHQVGVSPFGKRKENQPAGYKIDTHYRKKN